MPRKIELGEPYIKRNGHLVRHRYNSTTRLYEPCEPIPPRVEKVKPFRPMLANLHKGEDLAFPVIAQPKIDGIRCIARPGGLFSREREPIERQPHIVAALRPLFDARPDLVLDGELFLPGASVYAIAAAARGTPDPEGVAFCLSIEMVDPSAPPLRLVYYVFDIVSDAPAGERQRDLDRIIDGIGSVERVPTVLCHDMQALDHHYRQCLADGYEGQMVRDPNAPYLNKRCREMLKRKPRDDAEAEIVRAEVRAAGNIVLRLRTREGIEFNAPAPMPARERSRFARMARALSGLEATFRFSGHLPSGAPRDPVVAQIHEFPRM